MVIRSATPADAEGIERIRIRGWQAAYRHIFPPEELDRLAVEWSWWCERITQPAPGDAYFVAEEDGALLGFANTGPSKREPDRFGELYGLYVDPGSWSRGIGRALLERAERELSTAWDEAVLWTLEHNPRTRRFYELAGWVADGERDTFERLGVTTSLVRYGKRLSRSASRE